MIRYHGHRTYDKALLHNLNLFDDYSVFGTMRFHLRLNKFQLKGVFLSFIRLIEVKNKGQWIVRFEGYNQGTQNLHFLLRDGFKEDNLNNLIRDIYKKFNILVATGIATGEFTRFDSSKGASWYMAKRVESDTILNPIAEDLDQGNYFEVSTAFKRAIAEFNERDEQLDICKKDRVKEDIIKFNEPLF